MLKARRQTGNIILKYEGDVVGTQVGNEIVRRHAKMNNLHLPRTSRLKEHSDNVKPFKRIDSVRRWMHFSMESLPRAYITWPFPSRKRTRLRNETATLILKALVNSCARLTR